MRQNNRLTEKYIRLKTKNSKHTHQSKVNQILFIVVVVAVLVVFVAMLGFEWWHKLLAPMINNMEMMMMIVVEADKSWWWNGAEYSVRSSDVSCWLYICHRVVYGFLFVCIFDNGNLFKSQWIGRIDVTSTWSKIGFECLICWMAQSKILVMSILDRVHSVGNI